MYTESYRELLLQYQTTISIVTKAKVKAITRLNKGDNPNDVIMEFMASLKGHYETEHCNELDILWDSWSFPLSKTEALRLLTVFFPLPEMGV